MRYVGGAVGHRNTFEVTKGLLESVKETYGVTDDTEVEEYLTCDKINSEDDEMLGSEERSDSGDDEDSSKGSENDQEDKTEDEIESEDEDNRQSGRGEESDEDLSSDPREALGFTMF